MLERAVQAPPRLLPVERQVDARRAGVGLGVEPGEGEAAQVELRLRLQAAQRLHQRAAAGVAVEVQLGDQLFERQVLVRVGVDCRRALAVQRREQAGLAAEVDAQGDGVDEEADQPLDLAPAAVGDRRPDRQVELPGGARQESAEEGREDHEEGRPLVAAERGEPRGDLGRKDDRPVGATEGLHRRPRPIGRQLERRRAGEPLAPEGEVARQHLPLEGLPLTDGEVGVLDRQRGERRRAPGRESSVERRHLADQDLDRPAVGGDVVEGEEQQVPGAVRPRGGRAQADQRRPQQRPAREVEGAPCLLARQALTLAALGRRGESGEVDQRQWNLPPRRDHLHRPPIGLREGGAQRLVAGGDRGQARRQGGEGQAPAEHQGGRHVVGDRAG